MCVVKTSEKSRKIIYHHFSSNNFFYAKIKGTLGSIAFPQDSNEWSLPESSVVLLGKAKHSKRDPRCRGCRRVNEDPGVRVIIACMPV